MQLGPGRSGSCLRRPFRARSTSGAGEEEVSTSPGESFRSSSSSCSNSRADSGGGAANASCSNSDCSSGRGGDGGSVLAPYDSSSSAASHAAASHDEEETAPQPAQSTMGLAAAVLGGGTVDNGGGSDGGTMMEFAPNMNLNVATPPCPSLPRGVPRPHTPFERPPMLAQQHQQQQPKPQRHNHLAKQPQQSSSSQSLSLKPMDSLSQVVFPPSPLRIGSPPTQPKSCTPVPPLPLPPAPRQQQQQQQNQKQLEQQQQLPYHPAHPEGYSRGWLSSRGQPHPTGDTLARGLGLISTPPASPQSAQSPAHAQLFKRRSSGQASITGPDGTTDDDWDAPLVPYIAEATPNAMLSYQGMPLERGASAPGCNGGADGGATASVQTPRAPTAPPSFALAPRRPEIPKLGLHKLLGGRGSGDGAAPDVADKVAAGPTEREQWAPVSGSQSARADWTFGDASRSGDERADRCGALTVRADWAGGGAPTSSGSALTSRCEMVKSVKSLLRGWQTARGATGSGYGCRSGSGSGSGSDGASFNPQGVARSTAAAAGARPTQLSRAEDHTPETAAAVHCWQRDTVATAMTLAAGERGRLAAIYSGMLRHGEAAVRPTLEYSLLWKQHQQQQPHTQVREVEMEEDQQQRQRRQQQRQQTPIVPRAEVSDPVFRGASKGPAAPHAPAPSAAIFGSNPVPAVPSKLRGSGVGMAAWNKSRAAAVAREVMPRSPGRDPRTSRR
ncbi:hypothetical protein VaNZ11_000846 [Volvox africanus]|uniref:Uncharacterized protein n=1 Tax=Volvox africanus TaxID=51714 RepID=A0ABQ5RN85_9CHLO|nr:hypothetical protein VaNZ11_000846 [Volvox africanus]